MLGIGFFPYSPGTIASIASIPVIYLLFSFTNTVTVALFTLTIYILSVISIQKYVSHPYDRSWIVIDEFLGMLVTLLPLYFFHSLTPLKMTIGLIAFRFFDIYKPLFIRKIDQMDTVTSVIHDDIVAGIVSALIVFLIVFLKP